jgi:hypothetical protein
MKRECGWMDACLRAEWRLSEACLLIRDSVEEVKNTSGGVVGYTLTLTPEETQRLFDLVDMNVPIHGDAQ